MSAWVEASAAAPQTLRRRGMRRCMRCQAAKHRDEFTGLSRTCDTCAPLAAAERRAQSHKRKRQASEPECPAVRFVPVAPLLAAITEAAERLRAEQGGLSDTERQAHGLMSARLTIAARAEVDSRTVYAWESGERSGVSLAAAERVMFAVDRFWWEVWDSERWPAEHEVAARVFG